MTSKLTTISTLLANSFSSLSKLIVSFHGKIFLKTSFLTDYKKEIIVDADNELKSNMHALKPFTPCLRVACVLNC